MNNKIYFPGLNGIRAIAALLVVFSHISLKSSELGFKYGHGIDMAGYGVTMFFVLSGYLITFLLLKEYDKKGTISYKNFYIRRILRIWPLYYLALIIACLIGLVQGENYSTSTLLFYVFFMPNVPYIFGGVIHLVAPLWSVGVEEQFYLFWPWLFKFRKNLYLIMWGIIITFLLLKLFLRVYENSNWYSFLSATRFHCMAIGGIGAYHVFNNDTRLKALYNRAVQGCCWIILAVSVYKPFHIFSFLDGEIYAVVFLIIILNVSSNPRPLVKLENRILNWLGNISYGIYVYHMFAIAFVFSLASYFPRNLSGVILIFSAIIVLTLAMAHISYHYFERLFLRAKEKFTVIASTNAPTLEKISDQFAVENPSSKSSAIS